VGILTQNLPTEVGDAQYASSVELKAAQDAFIELLQGKSRDTSQPMPTMRIHSALPDPATVEKSLIDDR